MTTMASIPSPAVTDLDQLTELFHRSEKPPADWRIGMEAEKFGVHSPGQTPLQYEGNQGVQEVFRFLSERFGYQLVSENGGSAPVALVRGDTSITLEPAAQFELSGAPQVDLHAVNQEFMLHLEELREVSDRFNLRFLHIGFHPLAAHDQLPWVPKRRYPVMAAYLPQQGRRGLDMMRRTATVQVNIDYLSERDAMDKLVTLLRLSPVIAAMTLHAPFIEGRRSALLSERQDVWMHMDPTRSGLILPLWSKPEPRYRDYVEWALDAGMFLFYRDGQAFENTGQSFRSFLGDGFDGHRPTTEDWQLHLGTLFPEVRLKSTIEIRCCDCLSPELNVAVVALLIGLTYDETALSAAREVAEHITLDNVDSVRQRLIRQGLTTKTETSTLGDLGRTLLDAAQGGLRRRARRDASGQDESRYLQPLAKLTGANLTPAEQLIAHHERSGATVADFVARCCAA